MSDLSLQEYNRFSRKCALVFAAVVCGTLIMVGASYAPLPQRSYNIAIILAGACVNAALVAGHLMHLLSERKTIYALVAFTTLFFAALVGLTIWSWYQVPGYGTY